MSVKLGQTVIYKANDVDRVAMRNHPYCNEQAHVSATVVAVWSDSCVNLSLHLDGYAQGLEWKTSVLKGMNKGEWMFPGEYENLKLEAEIEKQEAE